MRTHSHGRTVAARALVRIVRSAVSGSSAPELHPSLAEEAGLYAPHVTCYLHDSTRARDLPGHAVRSFEWACGNTAISQWHSHQAKLTVVEEIQAQAMKVAA